MSSKNIVKESKRRCTKKLIARTKAATTKCYYSAVRIIYRKYGFNTKTYGARRFISEMRTYKLLRAFNHDSQLPDNIEILKEEVDQLYLEKLCLLSTKMIEDIILADDTGHFPRAGTTIAILKNELTSRALLSSETKKR